jgi:hypothetical protein
LPRSTSLWKSSPVNHWHAMFGIFLGATSHTMTPWSVFPFFWIFLNSLAPLPNLGQTRATFDVCQVGWEPKFGVGSRVPHPLGTSMYSSPFFWGLFLVAPVQNWI